jgi:hypothetical protein
MFVAFGSRPCFTPSIWVVPLQLFNLPQSSFTRSAHLTRSISHIRRQLFIISC